MVGCQGTGRGELTGPGPPARTGRRCASLLQQEPRRGRTDEELRVASVGVARAAGRQVAELAPLPGLRFRFRGPASTSGAPLPLPGPRFRGSTSGGAVCLGSHAASGVTHSSVLRTSARRRDVPPEQRLRVAEGEARRPLRCRMDVDVRLVLC